MPTDYKTAERAVRPHFVVNPAAASGRARRWWQLALPPLRKRFPGLSYAVADDADHLGELAVEAVREDHTLLVGVGGDGTHHDIVNALVRAGLTRHLTYAPLPLGSGNDWCRTLGIPRHLLRWMDALDRGKAIDHRIGQLTYGDNSRYFLNVAGLAYDAEVVRRSASMGRNHRLLYPLLTAAYVAGYDPPRLIVEYDGYRIEGRFHTINFGIGRYNGGGMRLVPQASPTADTLALTYARDLPLRRIIANSWRFYTDTIGSVPGVTTTHADRVVITGATGLEADGEFLGNTKKVVAELANVRLGVLIGTP